jgi:hypothetical protein
MRNYKTLTLSLLVTLVALTAIFVATRSSQGRHAAPEKKTIKVLRKKDQLGVKPTTQEVAAQAQPERELEDKIPKHLPIKIKVKNLHRENWARDLEIEVTNTSSKPIYYLFLILTLPEVKSDSNRTMGFQLGYGRNALVDFAAPLQANDVPLKPGESYTLKIPEQFSRGWERFAERRKLPKAEPKKVLIRFGQLNFGDGTGFSATDGEPIDIHPKQSFNRFYGEDADKVVAAARNGSPRRPPDSSSQPSNFFLPANFLPVKLSMASVGDSTSTAASFTVDVCGCQGSSCYRLKYDMAACCGDAVLIAASAGCSDPAGRCRSVEDQEFPCAGDYPCIGNALVSCPTADLSPRRKLRRTSCRFASSASIFMS